MRKPLFLVFLWCVLAPRASFGHTLFESGGHTLLLDLYARTEAVSFKNVVDLDNRNKDDSTVYLGLDYSLGFTYEDKNRMQGAYLKLERNGPYDYDAPLFVHNTLMTSGGVIEKYRNDELLPQIEEFWLDQRFGKTWGVKTGLYCYEVGNGFSLNGGYENYGVALYRASDNFSWHLYYCRPDLVYREHLGPRIRQDEEQWVKYEHNAANFFATDARWGNEKNFIQPYVGALADYTSPGKRDNVFAAPVKKDILGTFGFAWNMAKGDFALKSEFARNFGQAESADAAYKDIAHTGFLAYAQTAYTAGNFKPAAQILACSGNKVTPESALNQEEALSGGRNRAFSYYSPFNKNLGDSVSSANSEARPIVAMGTGYGLNYGIPRPRTFSATDFDNIVVPSLGFDYDFTPALCLGIYGYYLRSFERGVGLYNGEARYLSAELGYETDVFLDYSVNERVTVSFLGGYFSPGKYYKELRDDIDGSLCSSFLRGDGKADGAYQIELAMEIKF